ncbi:hypothetical protein MMC14_008987 [Varicellaria rhodocarpa]|nr:hypothetical protein [Varicellaria rhodocarpa]
MSDQTDYPEIPVSPSTLNNNGVSIVDGATDEAKRLSLVNRLQHLSLQSVLETKLPEFSQLSSTSHFLPSNTLIPRDVFSGASNTSVNPLYPSLNSVSARDALSRTSATSSPSSFRLPQPVGDVLSGASNTPFPNPLLYQPLDSTCSTKTQRSASVTPHRRASLDSLPEAHVITPPHSVAIRRASSHLFLSSDSSMLAKPPTVAPVDETSSNSIPPDAVYACQFFRKELEAHNVKDHTPGHPEVAIVLHDACYGHRYARSDTLEADLSSIVERPERVKATILGLAAAYVRLGGRHTGGIHPLQSDSEAQFVQSIPFVISKSSRAVSLGSSAVVKVHGIDWMRELCLMCEVAEAKLSRGENELARSFDSITKEGETKKPSLSEGDLYLCAESLNALEGSLGAVCDAVDMVFADTGPTRAFVCVRPPGHHCSADYPSGFCWVNNVHVGISHAILTHGLTHAVIIDFDLHHGDGSQSIAWKHNARTAALPKRPVTKITAKTDTKPRTKAPTKPFTKPAAKANARNAKSYAKESERSAIGYFSIHDINSYPCEMGDLDKVMNASMCMENAHGQTIWNVHLQPWKSDLEFWDLYEERYLMILNKARAFLKVHSARIRACQYDVPPKAAIFISAGFDASEWETPEMQRHGANVPTDFYARLTRDIVALANEEDLGVDGRVISVLEGGYSDRALTSGVMSHVCGLSGGEARDGEINPPEHEMPSYNREWWAEDRLKDLEALVNLSTTTTLPNTATVPQRTASVSQWAQTSSPPEVSWATAAHELCKLLVPTSRETKSFRAEELEGEASRLRRLRQLVGGIPPKQQAPHMQLRVRKPRASAEQSDHEAPASRISRRQTIAGAAVMDAGAEGQIEKKAKRWRG